MAEPDPRAQSPYALTALSPVTVATQPVVVNNLPPLKLEFWEGPGAFPAVVALIAVIVGYKSLQASTQKQIDAAALRAQEQLTHAADLAHGERLAAAEQAQKDRDYSAEQATKTRLLEARQTIYAELIDDYVAVQQMFGSMVNLDLVKNPTYSAPLQKMAASVNKTWLLSDVDTSVLIRDFYSELNEMHMRLLALVPPLQSTRDRLESLYPSLTKAHERQTETALALKEVIESMISYAPDSSARKREAVTLHGEAVDWASELTQAVIQERAEQKKLIKEFGTTLVEEQTSFMQHINRVMAAARSELSLVGDSAVLEAQSAAMSIRAKQAIKGLVDKLNEFESEEPSAGNVADDRIAND